MERFVRTEMLFGAEVIEIFRNSTVAVSGLGGVGSAAAEMLVRNGIGTIVLNDFDVVSFTDINRQIIALDENIGRKKTAVLSQRLKSINPKIIIKEYDIFCDETNRDEIFGNADFIIDAIDSLGPKAGLIEYAYTHNKNIISCMGAGNRIDPGKVLIQDLKTAQGCPLLKRVKKYLRKRNIFTGIPVVYSSEVPIINNERIINDTFRGRPRETIGSVSYLPIIFAAWATSYVIRKLSTPT